MRVRLTFLHKKPLMKPMEKRTNLIIAAILGMILGYFLGKADFSTMKNIAPQSCTYKGITYKDGEGFNDDCNSCSCINGEVGCTLMACEGN